MLVQASLRSRTRVREWMSVGVLVVEVFFLVE